MRPNYLPENDPRRLKPPAYAPPQPSGPPAPIDQPGGVIVRPGGGMPMLPGLQPGDGLPSAPVEGDPMAGTGGPDISALIEELMNRQAPRGTTPSPVARLLRR